MAAGPSGASGVNFGEMREWHDWYMTEFEQTLPGSPKCVEKWFTGLRDSIRAKLEDGGELAYSKLTKLAHTLYAVSLTDGVYPSLNRKTADNFILPLYEVLIETSQDDTTTKKKEKKSSSKSKPSPSPQILSLQDEAKLMATCFQTEKKIICSLEILKIGYSMLLIADGSFTKAFNKMLEQCSESMPAGVATVLPLKTDQCSDYELGTKMVLGEFGMIWELLRKLEEASFNFRKKQFPEESEMTIEKIIDTNPLFDIEYQHFIQSPGNGTNLVPQPQPPGNANSRGNVFRRIRNSIAHAQYNMLIGDEGENKFVFRNKGETSPHTHIIVMDSMRLCTLMLYFTIYIRDRLLELRNGVFRSNGIAYL